MPLLTFTATRMYSSNDPYALPHSSALLQFRHTAQHCPIRSAHRGTPCARTRTHSPAPLSPSNLPHVHHTSLPCVHMINI